MTPALDLRLARALCGQRLTVRTAIVALPLFLPLQAVAQQTSPADQLYVRSGLQAQLAHVAEIFAAGFREQAADQQLPERLLEGIGPLAQRAYSPAYFRSSIVPAIDAALSHDEIQALLAWLDSPLGRRLTAAEERAATVQAQRDRQAYAAALEHSPPSDHRLELIAALDESAGITAAAVDSAVNTHAAISIAISATSAYPSYEELLALKEQLTERRAEIHAHVREQVMLDLLFTYRELPDEALQAYVEFADSPLGQRYHETLNDALDEAYTRASWKLGQAIATLLDQLPGSIET